MISDIFISGCSERLWVVHCLKSLGSRLFSKWQGSEAVSYTHLDVYKRQDHYFYNTKYKTKVLLPDNDILIFEDKDLFQESRIGDKLEVEIEEKYQGEELLSTTYKVVDRIESKEQWFKEIYLHRPMELKSPYLPQHISPNMDRDGSWNKQRANAERNLYLVQMDRDESWNQRSIISSDNRPNMDRDGSWNAQSLYSPQNEPPIWIGARVEMTSSGECMAQ